MHVARASSALFFMLLFCLAAAPRADSSDQQRQRFVAAESALDRNDLAEFNRLAGLLEDYPLRPYLDYAALMKRLGKADESEVSRFLQQNAETVLADRLRRNWLFKLAKQNRWPTFLRFYEPTSNVSLQCHRLQGLLATGRQQAALQDVEPIWLHGKSRPKACDPAFAAWEKAGLRTDAKNWQRIALAMENGQWRLARYLGRDLSSEEDRVWLGRWIALYQNPRGVENSQRFANAHPYRETMLAFTIRRLARWDGLDAMQRWQRIKPKYDFTAAQIARTEKYIIRNLVRVNDDDAYAFIRQVALTDEDEKAHEARIRAALLREDWPQVERWIAALPATQKSTDGWRYWAARALEGAGKQEEADKRYADVAAERSYYGFLAADRIDADYHLLHADTPVEPSTMQQISELGAVRRARELFFLQRWTDARREWISAISDMSPEQLKAAAKIAEQKGWHDRAIFTLARTGYWDDLELRFPLQHTDLVTQNAALHNIDMAWVFAVMRQESAFMRHARSHAGAMGLMQLMPATARAVARDVLKLKPPRRQELLRPETNIALGSAYLGQMKNKLGNSAILATAAYNAGPHRVTRWLPERTLPADIWIELVPFKETRGYLRRVLAYTVIYESRMGLSPTRLKDRMHPVSPEIDMMSTNTQVAIGAG